MQEKHSHFITIKAQSKALFENPFLPVFAVDSGNSDKSRFKKKLVIKLSLWCRSEKCDVL